MSENNDSVTAISHARIYTVDNSFSVYIDGTIVFDESGILALGKTGKVSIPSGARLIDGKGRMAILPGLIDTHSHSSLLKGYTENGQWRVKDGELVDLDLPALRASHKAQALRLQGLSS